MTSGVRSFDMRLLLVTVVAMLLLHEGAYAQDPSVWTEHYDPKQNRKYYYNAAEQKTQWDPPTDAKIQYMDDGEQKGGTGAQKREPTSALTILGVALAPVLLVVGGLLCLYWQASKNGLEDALKNLRNVRDRSAKRRSSKAGSKFKAKFKLSQDGKGGRSANS